jgi:hypothetical protein
VPIQIDEARRRSVNVPAIKANKGVENIRPSVLWKSARVFSKKAPKLMLRDLRGMFRHNAFKYAPVSYCSRSELYHLW